MKPDADPNGERRAVLVDRFAVVRGFVPLLATVIEFGASTEATPVLAALHALPKLLEGRPSKRVSAGWLDARSVDLGVVPARWWARLVLPPQRPEGTAAKAPYVFCVLEVLHQHLTRRDIFAPASTRWADPRDGLLIGRAWEQAKGPALGALGLPERSQELLAGHAHELNRVARGTPG